MTLGPYISLNKTVHHFQHELKESAMTGENQMSVADIIKHLRSAPMYDLDKVLKDITDALVADDENTNCLTGNNTEHVVVTKDKLDQIIFIIKNGGMIHERKLR